MHLSVQPPHLKVFSYHGIWLRFKRLWPLALPVLLLIPGLLAFPYPSPDARYSDMVITHYPNALYLRRAIYSWHTIPLWSPSILSGYPFFANPLSGLWYPPGWLVLILPLPSGFNILVAGHLLWGSIGMYFLLRANGIGYRAALFGGLAFSMMPKLFAHYGAGHLTLLYALTWTPWLLYFSSNRRFTDNTYYVQQIIILAIIFLADVRWAVYAGIVWIAYNLIQYRNTHYSQNFIHQSLTLIRQTIIALLLVAPFALPLLEYTFLSTRAKLAASDVFAFSLPPERLLGLVYPDFGGFHEWIVYSGAVILIFAIFAVLWHSTRRLGKFWIWVVALSLVWSLGSFIPFLSTLTHVPGISLLRVPPRSLFLTIMALIVLAALGLDHLLSGGLSSIERRHATQMMVAIVGFVFVLAAGVWVITGNMQINYAWGAGAILIGSIWAWIGFNGIQGSDWRWSMSESVWYIGLLVLCLIDLGAVNMSLFTSRRVDIVFAEGKEVAQYFAHQLGDFRVYSPSYSLPQQTAARYELQLVDGVDPLQLESYAAFMEGATGIPRTGYSVTMPPFRGKDPTSANKAYTPTPSLLGLLNVRYIASEFEITEDNLVLRKQFGETRLYENKLVQPKAWVQPREETFAPSVRPAQIDYWEANRISISAEGPGVLVLSEIFYPGWRVSVDGLKSDIVEVNRLLRGVSIGSGEHQVIFVYRPLSVYAGLILCALGVFALIFPRNLRE